jgi:hypothetical protein
MKLSAIIARLRKAEGKLEKELQPIKAALAALDAGKGVMATRHARKKLSPASRAKMARAAKKRWKAHREKARKLKTTRTPYDGIESRSYGAKCRKTKRPPRGVAGNLTSGTYSGYEQRGHRSVRKEV